MAQSMTSEGNSMAIDLPALSLLLANHNAKHDTIWLIPMIKLIKINDYDQIKKIKGKINDQQCYKLKS